MSEETKNQVGRPTLYNQELQAKADGYIFAWKDEGHVIPSRVGLCCYLGISKKTSQRWEVDYPEFSATLSNIETMQEFEAMKGGLTNAFNSTITKLVLANHGYTDKVQQDLTSSDGTMTPKETGSAVLEALSRKHADT